jgi:pimeloyl-ACP methyl ester carboxylesterase
VNVIGVHGEPSARHYLENKLVPNIVESAGAIAASGKKAFVQGTEMIASGAAWTPSGMLSQYLSNRTERDNPPTGRFVEVDGIPIHYLERGAGMPVVLLHGNGTMAYEFEVSSLLGLAAEKYRVLAFDRPGYGYSGRPRGQAWTSKEQADLLFKALNALGIDQAVIVGHSWGTMVATTLALEHPECVRSLVLLSGYYYPTPRVDVMLLSPPSIPGFGDVIRPTISPFIGRMLWPSLIQKFFSPFPVTPRWHATFPKWMTLRPSQILASAAETALMTVEAFWLAQRYHELRMPVVIMAGTDDMHVSTSVHSEQLHGDIPHSQLVLVPGVGHMIHHVVPDQVLKAIDMAAS